VTRTVTIVAFGRLCDGFPSVPHFCRASAQKHYTTTTARKFIFSEQDRKALFFSRAAEVSANSSPRHLKPGVE
jgi:hypothetical protein